MTTKTTTTRRRKTSPTRKITLRQKTRLKGRVTPQRTSEASVRMKVHNPGPWGDAEMILLKDQNDSNITTHGTIPNFPHFASFKVLVKWWEIWEM